MSLSEDYPAGREFRVIKEGAHLSGWTPVRSVPISAYQGWRRNLEVGEVITSLGFGPGFGADPGYGIHWTCADVTEAHASSVMFTPSAGGVFDYHPADGYLEPVK